MNSEQIDKIFELIRKSKPNSRQNIRTIYLDRIGNEIIPYCEKHYLDEKKADVRNDLVRFVLQYAKTDKRTLDFAKRTLNDKSKKVKESGLAIFAYSGDKTQIDFLKGQEANLKSNSDDLHRAINAIKNGNHNLFYPEYNRWTITTNDLKKHLRKEEFKEDVDLYIKKYAKEIVPELTSILGTLY
ncbi:hypothetical protein [uncultured Lacinutrix sp.]|uniref:hypothetical protein n=1 Tax=uncultured Lacinutrix sp. TaxID=574032 RepID=UPI00260D952B|nr:hypothetical protein [uncultured Lacinutrix sp.]